jgi:hypothetical protein
MTPKNKMPVQQEFMFSNRRFYTSKSFSGLERTAKGERGEVQPEVKEDECSNARMK